MSSPVALEKSLGSLQLWGLAVGLVISGEYFGWSYGWATAGTLGFLCTTALVALFYVAFLLGFAELAAALPEGGAAFAYTKRAFGPQLGFLAGFAALVEFVFAPPAIALSIGAYLHVQFPALPASLTASACYLVFIVLNIRGVQLAARLELVVTLLAILELCVFVAILLPAFSLDDFRRGGWAGQSSFHWAALPGIFAAVPFAIWFFLAIEGAALAVEETRDPERAVPRAFGGGILTLVVLAFAVMLAAGGVGDWTSLANRNDPLPEAMKRVVGQDSGWLHMLVWVGLFGLVASFHGIILGYSRQIFAMARAGYLPRWLAAVHPRHKTPHLATWAGGGVGLVAVLLDGVLPTGTESLTSRMVTLSVLGALTLYVLSSFSLLGLRRREPELRRPFRMPLYPWLAWLAAGLALLFLGVVVWTHPGTSLFYGALLVGAGASFRLRAAAPKGVE